MSRNANVGEKKIDIPNMCVYYTHRKVVARKAYKPSSEGVSFPSELPAVFSQLSECECWLPFACDDSSNGLTRAVVCQSAMLPQL